MDNAIAIGRSVYSMTAPRQLPDSLQTTYRMMAANYRASRLFASDQDADRAAFEQVRAHYWKSLMSRQDQHNA
jgi:hypothetical protein